MTDQHRAAPEQWDYVDVWGVVHDCAPSSCILELRDRIEALEAAQLEQAESHRFCTDAIVRRVEALEAFDHHPLLAAVRAQSKAVAHFGNRLEALEAAQRYQFRSATEKVPTTRLYSYSVGPAKPLDELGQGHTLASPEPASAEAQSGRLVERVTARIEFGINAELDPEGIARAAIREVTAAAKERIAPFNPWLRWNDVAQWLEQEADRG